MDHKKNQAAFKLKLQTNSVFELITFWNRTTTEYFFVNFSET